MDLSPEALERLPALWRTERIFLPPGGILARQADCWLMLTPSNPTFWWGNTLVMDGPPQPGDYTAWTDRFERLVQQRQPASAHMTFAWEGGEEGVTAPFLAAGFSLLRILVMQALAPQLSGAPAAAATLRQFADDDWPQLIPFLVAAREPSHDAAAYRPFVANNVANWQRLSRADQGNWFGAFEGPTLVAALGLFVEPRADRQGRRLARFQNVVTRADRRRRGLCAALMRYAVQAVALRYAPTCFVLQADADGEAQRIYRRLGFEVSARSFGLERAPTPKPAT